MLNAHSGFRYLVMIAGLIVIGYAVYGMATGRSYDKTMRITSAIFTGLVDLTALLGIVTLLSGTFYPALTGHITMMVLAIVVAHVVSVVIKRRPEEERTYTPHLVGTLVVLGLIAVGIMTIGRPLVGS
ncbi:MAG: hypothetical protein VYA31_04680 [Gemmatimonadota bacterium]|nr:hypothetical protein [Gemmatimonadota bacterium]